MTTHSEAESTDPLPCVVLYVAPADIVEGMAVESKNETRMDNYWNMGEIVSTFSQTFKSLYLCMFLELDIHILPQ